MWSPERAFSHPFAIMCLVFLVSVNYLSFLSYVKIPQAELLNS